MFTYPLYRFYLLPSHLECQVCLKKEGPRANRWLPTRHQVFSTLPLPIPTSSRLDTRLQNRAVTAGNLPAGGMAKKECASMGASASSNAILRGGGQSGGGTTRVSSGATGGLGQMQGSSIDLYSCLQESFREESLSGISCSACSIAAFRKGLCDRAATGDEYSEVYRRIVEDAKEEVWRKCIVGERDAFIGDIDETVFTSTSQRDFEMLAASLPQKASSDAVKRTSISRLPPLLCLYLCRRTYDELKGHMKKVAQHVNFPVSLDMRQFHAADGPLLLNNKNAVFANLFANKPSSVDTQYLLRAVVVHMGNAESGKL